MNRSPFLAAVPALALLLASCEDKVNAASYGAIKPGMTQTQVEKIMGGKGERVVETGMSISSATIATTNEATRQSTYVWKTGTKELSVTFEDGKVIQTGKAGF